MYRLLLTVVITLSLATFSTGSLADPPGLERENKVPPGLAKGGTPPGWQNASWQNGKTVPAKETILKVLTRTDGAQALAAAIRVVDESGLSSIQLGELLDDPRANVILAAPSNSGFEAYLKLPKGGLDDLDIDTIALTLPNLLDRLELNLEDLRDVLFNHVAVRDKKVDPGNASARALLEQGQITVAAESEFPVGIGDGGVWINREANITERDVFTVNGVIHYLDSVIVDVPPEEEEPPADDSPSAIEAWCDRDVCQTSDSQFNQCVDFMGTCLAGADTGADREQCAGAGLLICVEIEIF